MNKYLKYECMKNRKPKEESYSLISKRLNISLQDSTIHLAKEFFSSLIQEQ